MDGSSLNRSRLELMVLSSKKRVVRSWIEVPLRLCLIGLKVLVLRLVLVSLWLFGLVLVGLVPVRTGLVDLVLVVLIGVLVKFELVLLDQNRFWSRSGEVFWLLDTKWILSELQAERHDPNPEHFEAVLVLVPSDPGSYRQQGLYVALQNLHLSQHLIGSPHRLLALIG